MKRLLFALTAILLMTSTAYAQSEAAESQENTPIEIDNMKGFHSIRVLGNLSVAIYETDGDPEMSVDVKENEPRRFDWGIRDSVLTISFSANSNGNATQVVLKSNTPIRKLVVKRADVQLCNLSTDNLMDVTLKEGARMSGEFSCLDLNLQVLGRSVASLQGRAKYQTIDVGRRCALNAADLEGFSTELKVGGASEVYVCATERFVTNIKGRTSVFYDGNPTIVRTSKSAISTLNSIGAR